MKCHRGINQCNVTSDKIIEVRSNGRKVRSNGRKVRSSGTWIRSDGMQVAIRLQFCPMEERYDPMEWKYDPVEREYDPMECKWRLDCSFVQWKKGTIQWNGSTIQWNRSTIQWNGSTIQWNRSTIQWNTSTIQWNASGDKIAFLSRMPLHTCVSLCFQVKTESISVEFLSLIVAVFRELLWSTLNEFPRYLVFNLRWKSLIQSSDSQ